MFCSARIHGEFGEFKEGLTSQVRHQILSIQLVPVHWPPLDADVADHLEQEPRNGNDVDQRGRVAYIVVGDSCFDVVRVWSLH